MFGFILRHPIAVGLSVLLHIVLIALITFQWAESASSPKISIQSSDDSKITNRSEIRKVEPLKTFAVDASLVKEQMARIKKEEASKLKQQRQLEAKTDKERQRLKQLERKKRIEQAKAKEAKKQADLQRLATIAEQKKTAEARKKTDEAELLADLEIKKAEAERLKADKAKLAALEAEKAQKLATDKAALAVKSQREAELQKIALEEENIRKAAENKKLAADALKAQADKEKAQAAALLRQQLDEEAAQQRAAQKRKQMLSLKETYISSIAAKVKDNWRTPAKISAEAQCDLKITQTPTGSVSSVKVLNCNKFASKQFKEAAEKAVYRSEPIPQPPVPELFERVITFEFKP